MSIPPKVVRIAETLVDTALRGRNDRIRYDLYRRQHDANESGKVQTAFYVADQQEACIAELAFRVDSIWHTYRRVLSEERLLFTDSVRTEIVRRVNQMLDTDVPYVEEMARNVITNHGHGFELFLREARPFMVARLVAELDLFALQHRPAGASVRDQLGAPRYAGPREHWLRVDRAMSQAPPDFATAARDAVNAVEGLAKIIAALPNATLGECVKSLRTSERLDGATAKGLEALWGFANSSPGFRHEAPTVPTLTQAEAEYVVQSSEAATKLLLNIDAADG